MCCSCDRPSQWGASPEMKERGRSDVETRAARASGRSGSIQGRTMECCAGRRRQLQILRPKLPDGGAWRRGSRAPAGVPGVNGAACVATGSVRPGRPQLKRGMQPRLRMRNGVRGVTRPCTSQWACRRRGIRQGYLKPLLTCGVATCASCLHVATNLSLWMLTALWRLHRM